MRGVRIKTENRFPVFVVLLHPLGMQHRYYTYIYICTAAMYYSTAPYTRPDWCVYTYYFTRRMLLLQRTNAGAFRRASVFFFFPLRNTCRNTKTHSHSLPAGYNIIIYNGASAIWETTMSIRAQRSSRIKTKRRINLIITIINGVRSPLLANEIKREGVL